MSEGPRRTRIAYHHGDLRRALLEAGVGLAREGGPDKIVLREAARIVGVAPNSAYSHFATLVELKAAVAQEALKLMGAAMAAHVESVIEPDDPREAAMFHLGEVGRAYVQFALDEPGLFRTGMAGNPAGVGTPSPNDDHTAGASGVTGAQGPKPDAVLLAALSRLTDVGGLPPQQTATAVTACWATVHGLAGILLDLQPDLLGAERDAAIDAGLRVLLLGVSALRED